MSVNWNLLPEFIQEGVIDFFFRTMAKHKSSWILLHRRVGLQSETRPDNDCSTEEILHYLAGIREEWVSELI